MEAHLAPTQPTQVNKITTPYEICSGPHDTQNCMEIPEQAFVEYASSRTDEAGEGLVSEFMASQHTRLSKFKADFKQPQSEMINKIDTMLKAITDRIACTLPSDTVKNPKLGTHPVSSARSYPTMDPQCSTQFHGSVNTIIIHPKQPKESQVNRPKVDLEEDNSGDTNSNPHPQPNPFASISTKQVRKLNSMLESLRLVPQSSNTKFICSKEDDGEVMFIEIIRDDEPQNEDPHDVEGATTEEPIVEYFDTFPTRNELTYHRYLMSGPIPSIFLRNHIITEGCPHNLKIPCNIRHMHIEKAYIDLNSPLNIMTRMMYNWIMRRKLVELGMDSMLAARCMYLTGGGLGEEVCGLEGRGESRRRGNEEDKRRGVEYVMSKILGFYKECLELGPEYLTGVDDEGEVTKFFIKNKNFVFTDGGDGVTINTRRRHHDTCDGVRISLTASNAQVIFDEKKLGSS
ncbi:hypothetical protein Tco_1098909 [Tanacetum coccineum]